MTTAEFLQLQFGWFNVFAMPTFITGEDLADGTEDPDLFDPTGMTSAAATRAIIAAQLDAVEKAGMRYMVLTAHSLDGFGLWVSTAQPHCIAAGAWYGTTGIDLVREYCNQARARNLKVGLYFSVQDLNYEDNGGDVTAAGYLAFTRARLDELLGGEYGNIDILWCDSWLPALNIQASIRAYAQSLQSGCLVTFNDSHDTGLHGANGLAASDFITYQGPLYGTPQAGLTGTIELNHTVLAGQWFGRDDVATTDVIGIMATAMSCLWTCRTRGYNFLLDLPPSTTGDFSAGIYDVLDRIWEPQKTAIAGARDSFDLNEGESVGQPLVDHVSVLDGEGYTMVNGSGLLISPDGQLRGGANDYATHDVTPPGADYRVDVEGAFHTLPATQGSIGAITRLGATLSPAGYMAHINFPYVGVPGIIATSLYDEAFGQVETSTAGIPVALAPLGPNTNNAFGVNTVVKASMSSHGTAHRARFYLDGYLILTIKGTDATVSDANKPGLHHVSNPGSDSTGIYITRMDAYTEDFTAPSAPTSPTAVEYGQYAVVRWTPPVAADLAFHRIYASTDAGSTWVAMGSTADASTATLVVSGLNPAASYLFAVTALDTSYNESSRSSSATPTHGEVAHQFGIGLSIGL